MRIRLSKLVCFASAVVLSLAVAVPAHANAYVLKFHTWASKDSAEFKLSVLPWIRQVEKAAEGRLRFDVHTSMRLGGKPENLFEQVRTGKVDVVWTRPGFSGKRFERLEAFELPFILTDPEAVSRAYWEYAQAYAADALNDVHLLALHVGGPALIHTRAKPINNLASLKNMRLSATSVQSAKLLAALGAKPVMLPGGATRSALAEQTIDGVLAPWDAASGLNDKTIFHTEFEGRALNASSHMLAINTKLYQSLPVELKKAIDGKGGLETSAALGLTFKKRDNHLRAARHAGSIMTLAGDDAVAFRKAAASVETQWVKKVTADGFDGQKLLDGARTLIRQHTN